MVFLLVFFSCLFVFFLNVCLVFFFCVFFCCFLAILQRKCRLHCPQVPKNDGHGVCVCFLF